MRRYTVTVNDRPHVIDVEEVTAASFRVRYDGRTLDVRLDDQQDLSQALISPTIEVRTTGHPASPVTPIPVPIPSHPQATGEASSGPGRPPGNQLTAPMPGVVWSVETAAGQTVERGDPLLVLEAMKMKNSLHAPRDALVTGVLVAPGQQVTYGEVLVTFADA